LNYFSSVIRRRKKEKKKKKKRRTRRLNKVYRIEGRRRNGRGKEGVRT
jgi:hypothetical protein